MDRLVEILRSETSNVNSLFKDLTFRFFGKSDIRPNWKNRNGFEEVIPLWVREKSQMIPNYSGLRFAENQSSGEDRSLCSITIFFSIFS